MQLKQRRFRPSLMATIVAMGFTALFSGLGIWQVYRAGEKESLAASFQAQRKLPALDLAADAVDIDGDRYRGAKVTGTYAKDHLIYVDNVVFDGRPGYEIFTPLRIEKDGRQILVDRGWVAQGASRATLPEVAVPEGSVTVTGWLDHPRSLPVIVAGEISPDETLWPYLDMQAVAARTGSSLPDLVLHADADPVAALHHKAPEFNANVGMHIGYAIQWFAFAAAAAGTYIAVNLKKQA